ncbi:MAG: citrate synthase [Actinomycetota bacterium]
MAETRATTVREIMSSPVLTAAPDDAMTETARRMQETGVGSVVVVDDGRCVGIVTERDLIRLAAQGTSDIPVSELMTADPDTVDPDTPLTEAFNQMEERSYRHLPVVEDGRLLGIVSIRDLMHVAQIQPVGTPAAEIPKGLEGVPVAETEIGDVRGREGFFHYRQYSAPDLARARTFEDAWHLLFEGKLPDERQRKEFIERVRPLRVIPDAIRDLLPAVARLGEEFVPLDALRSTYSLMAGALGYRPWLDAGVDELRQQALRTCAVFPTLVTALYRLRQGQEPVEPHPDLDHAANYLYMMSGERPDQEAARAIETYLTLTIDHGFNASTFTARVITSTGADLGSAICGALGALSGPLHGGAPSRALDMIEEIGDRERAEPWLRDAVTEGRRLMGFGHRVYRTDDPRSVMLRDVAERLNGERVQFAKYVEEKAVEVLHELKPGRELYPNVEYYAGIVLDIVGMPRELFTPTFACSRVIGWCAHVMEQAADNRLIRPSARYVGPEPPEPVPAA